MENGDLVGDWRLLLIRRARSSRQVVGAEHPWQLIGGSSCQVPLGKRLLLRLHYLFHFQMHLSVFRSIFDNAEPLTRDASHEPTVRGIQMWRQPKLCFLFLSQGLGGKPGPRGQRGPTVGVPAQHAPSRLMIDPAQIAKHSTV